LLKNGNKGRFEILSLLLRLRQFCCHPSLLPGDFNCRGTPSAKMELLKELVLESVDSSHKLLVFSQFPSLLKIARNWLDEKEIACEYLDGETTNRMERVINFNKNDSIAVFLLSIKAGGSGLNLTSADRVIIYDPWWNPAVETQAADRAHRIGQTRPVSIQKIIVRNSIEEKILSLQEKKMKIFRNIVEGAPSAFSGLTQDDIRFLFS
jgi:SNF2 family DNA or RNA helicase